MTFPTQLTQSEYLHVLFNPTPVYGLAMGVLAVLVSIVLRSRSAHLAAMILICVSGLSAWPTYHYGEAAYDRVLSMSDRDGGAWLKEHAARAEKMEFCFYLLAGLSLLALIIPMIWPRTLTLLSLVTLAAALITLGIGGWIAYAGGHVRHKEFRYEPIPGSTEARS
jgi:hypothetical protein